MKGYCQCKETRFLPSVTHSQSLSLQTPLQPHIELWQVREPISPKTNFFFFLIIIKTKPNPNLCFFFSVWVVSLENITNIKTALERRKRVISNWVKF